MPDNKVFVSSLEDNVHYAMFIYFNNIIFILSLLSSLLLLFSHISLFYIDQLIIDFIFRIYNFIIAFNIYIYIYIHVYLLLYKLIFIVFLL